MMTGFLSVLSSLPLHKLKQDGTENQVEVEEQTFKEKELDRKPGDVPLDILSTERYIKCFFYNAKLFQCNKHYLFLFLSCEFVLCTDHTISAIILSVYEPVHLCVLYKGLLMFLSLNRLVF
jgi:hypothetical protein